MKLRVAEIVDAVQVFGAVECYEENRWGWKGEDAVFYGRWWGSECSHFGPLKDEDWAGGLREFVIFE